MKKLKQRNRIIYNLRQDNLRLQRKVDKLSAACELYKSDISTWMDEKYELLEVKRRYIMLLERLELNDEKFNKAMVGLLPNVTGGEKIYIMDKKYEK